MDHKAGPATGLGLLDGVDYLPDQVGSIFPLPLITRRRVDYRAVFPPPANSDFMLFRSNATASEATSTGCCFFALKGPVLPSRQGICTYVPGELPVPTNCLAGRFLPSGVELKISVAYVSSGVMSPTPCSGGQGMAPRQRTEAG
jgi:hypothetical protein